MKLFVAVLFPEDIRKVLVETMHEMKGMGVKGSYTAAASLHLTMTYIGDVPSAEPVRSIMAAIPFSPFHLQLTGPGHFDNTLWVGAKGGQKLKEFNNALRAGLDRAGIPYSPQKLEPHITLVRRAGIPWPREISIPRTEMTVKKISLMKSSQKDGRTVYTEIFSVS